MLILVFSILWFNFIINETVITLVLLFTKKRQILVKKIDKTLTIIVTDNFKLVRQSLNILDLEAQLKLKCSGCYYL